MNFITLVTERRLVIIGWFWQLLLFRLRLLSGLLAGFFILFLVSVATRLLNVSLQASDKILDPFADR